MPRLSGVMIVKNEALNLKACLDSAGFCDEWVVIDSGSSDGTAELARTLGAKVWERPFDDYASQKNFGIQKASGEWVLLLDADERVSEGLKEEIQTALRVPTADGYQMRRLNRIFGRWMKHGANQEDLQLRLAKRSKAVFHGPVHERVRPEGKIARFKEPLFHHSTGTIADYMRKLNVYTSLEAAHLSGKANPPLVRRLKALPLARLGQLIFLKRAFLDGLEGVLFAILSAYYDFVSLAKHWENSQKGVS